MTNPETGPAALLDIVVGSQWEAGEVVRREGGGQGSPQTDVTDFAIPTVPPPILKAGHLPKTRPFSLVVLHKDYNI